MKKLALSALVLSFVLVVAAFRAPAATNADQTFVGQISDSQCGFTHPMADARKCTLGCVKGFGATLVLADTLNHTIYQLSDQGKAKKYAGETVQVTGTLDGNTIEVRSIKGPSHHASAPDAPLPGTGDGMPGDSMSPVQPPMK